MRDSRPGSNQAHPHPPSTENYPAWGPPYLNRYQSENPLQASESTIGLNQKMFGAMVHCSFFDGQICEKPRQRRRESRFDNGLQAEFALPWKNVSSGLCQAVS